MCADYQGWYIKDENSAAGMAQLSVALSAKQSGRKVLLVGYGTCDRSGGRDGEDIKAIVIRPD
jgi:hypothetical protein